MLLGVQEHLQEVKRREEAQQAALAAKREEADRIYTRLKAEKEAAQAMQDEQDFLVNLLQQEEVEARQRQKEQDMLAYRVRVLVPRCTSWGALQPRSFYMYEDPVSFQLVVALFFHSCSVMMGQSSHDLLLFTYFHCLTFPSCTSSSHPPGVHFSGVAGRTQ